MARELSQLAEGLPPIIQAAVQSDDAYAETISPWVEALLVACPFVGAVAGVRWLPEVSPSMLEADWIPEVLAGGPAAGLAGVGVGFLVAYAAMRYLKARLDDHAAQAQQHLDDIVARFVSTHRQVYALARDMDVAAASPLPTPTAPALGSFTVAANAKSAMSRLATSCHNVASTLDAVAAPPQPGNPMLLLSDDFSPLLQAGHQLLDTYNQTYQALHDWAAKSAPQWQKMADGLRQTAANYATVEKHTHALITNVHNEAPALV